MMDCLILCMRCSEEKDLLEEKDPTESVGEWSWKDDEDVGLCAAWKCDDLILRPYLEREGGCVKDETVS